jgi:hypothetical protein
MLIDTSSARRAALEAALGSPREVLACMVPPGIGRGEVFVFVYEWRANLLLYATAGFRGDPAIEWTATTRSSVLVAHRDDAWPAEVMKDEAVLELEGESRNPGDVADLGEYPGNVRFLLCVPWDLSALAEHSTLALMIGITDRESRLILQYGFEPILGALRAAGAYPATRLRRKCLAKAAEASLRNECRFCGSAFIGTTCSVCTRSIHDTDRD